MNMVRSMLSNSTLPVSLWMEALKTATHISNRVPSKSVPKALFVSVATSRAIRKIMMERSIDSLASRISRVLVQKSIAGRDRDRDKHICRVAFGGILRVSSPPLQKSRSQTRPKTPYELWTGRKPSMNYMHVWGCAAEAKLFNPSLGKLDPKTESCYFIGYPKKSKGYKFYCPKGITKFFETRHAIFLEENGCAEPRQINLEEMRTHDPIPR